MTSAEMSQILTRLRDIESVAKSTHSDRIWGWFIKGSVPVLLTTIVAVVGFASSVHTRLAIIENSRFTARDAQKMRMEILGSVPPQWLRDDLQEIKDRLKRLEERGK